MTNPGSKEVGLASPRWTVVYNIVSPESDTWVGTGWEFFDNEREADMCYRRHQAAGNVPTKRQFYDSVDALHLGIADQKQVTADSAGAMVGGISWAALLTALERLRSKNRNPDNEWYHGWNAAIQCLINDINARAAAASTVAPQQSVHRHDCGMPDCFVCYGGKR